MDMKDLMALAQDVAAKATELNKAAAAAADAGLVVKLNVLMTQTLGGLPKHTVLVDVSQPLAKI